MALAFLFRQSAMAIGIGLAYVLAIEGQNAAALITSFGQPFPTPGAAAPIVTVGVAVLVLIVYSVVFAGVTSLVVRARDVT